MWIDQEGEYCDEWQENVEVALQGAQVVTRALANRMPADKESFDDEASPVEQERMHAVKSEGVVVHSEIVAGGAAKIDRRGGFFRREFRLPSLGRSGCRDVVEVYLW